MPICELSGGQDVAFFLEGGDGDGRVGQEFAEVAYLDVEGHGVGVARVAPDGVENRVALHQTTCVLGKDCQEDLHQRWARSELSPHERRAVRHGRL